MMVHPPPSVSSRLLMPSGLMMPFRQLILSRSPMRVLYAVVLFVVLTILPSLMEELMVAHDCLFWVDRLQCHGLLD